jgi:hypothetical protein
MKSAELLCNELVSPKRAISSVKTFAAFLKEFDAWKPTIVKKEYSDDYLIGAIYKENVFFTKESEYTQLCVCHIEAASRCLHDIASEIGGDQHKYETYRHHIVDYLFDLNPVAKQVMKDTDATYEFIKGWKSMTESSVMLFKAARNLFWSSTLKTANPVEHRTALNLCVFALRQSLEIRFHRAIGIDKIVGPSLEAPKLRHDFFLNFVGDNLDLIQTNIASVSNLAHIYKWTNYSIHSGTFAKIWEIQYAFKYCAALFEPVPYKESEGWSLYSSIKIINYAELKSRLENAVNTAFPGKNWQFIYVQNPEAVTR